MPSSYHGNISHHRNALTPLVDWWGPEFQEELMNGAKWSVLVLSPLSTSKIAAAEKYPYHGPISLPPLMTPWNPKPVLDGPPHLSVPEETPRRPPTRETRRLISPTRRAATKPPVLKGCT